MNNRTYIYLISGKSQNGKDTLYSLCKEEVGWARVSFADKLKQTVSDLYNFSHEQMHGELKDTEDTRYPNLIDTPTLKTMPSLGPGVRGVGPSVEIPNPEYKSFLTPRRVLQLFGQQQRSLFPDIWASYVFTTTIPSLKEQGINKFVITDVRFKNEIKVAEQFADANTVITKVRINRPNILARTASSDISEVDLDDYTGWDFVIQNDGTLEKLKNSGLNIIQKVQRELESLSL